MEKVYMELPKKSLRVWKNDDISPYDFRDDERMNRYSNEDVRNNKLNNEDIINKRYQNEEDEYDMDAIMEELDRMDEQMQDECSPESDMYENGNIDFRCNEDVSQNMSSMHLERKTIVEEENPKRKTTTWMRVTRVY